MHANALHANKVSCASACLPKLLELCVGWLQLCSVHGAALVLVVLLEDLIQLVISRHLLAILLAECRGQRLELREAQPVVFALVVLLHQRLDLAGRVALARCYTLLNTQYTSLLHSASQHMQERADSTL